MGLGKEFKSGSWLKTLSTRTAERWCSDISNATIPAAKLLLGASREPTDDKLAALPRCNNVADAGVYFGLI